MAMFLRRIRVDVYTLFAVGTEAGCPVAEFLRGLEMTDKAEKLKLLALINRVAAEGPPRNEEKCRYFKEIKAFELKTTKVRLLAFWDEGRVIICSHAFLKKSQRTPNRELERLKKTRETYFVLKKMNTLKFEEKADCYE